MAKIRKSVKEDKRFKQYQGSIKEEVVGKFKIIMDREIIGDNVVYYVAVIDQEIKKGNKKNFSKRKLASQNFRETVRDIKKLREEAKKNDDNKTKNK